MDAASTQRSKPLRLEIGTTFFRPIVLAFHLLPCRPNVRICVDNSFGRLMGEPDSAEIVPTFFSERTEPLEPDLGDASVGKRAMQHR